MKKFITVLLSAAVLSLSSLNGYAQDKVEITFRVGESILNINGTPTQVETPYVVGEGTTLVPLRVITEVFGAEVDWDGDTKTITLTYPDVNITMQIGNTLATVNSHTETLAEAPRLSSNVTMVPLRFISETFGADVTYDNDTRYITVTKENFVGGDTVSALTELEHIGDSYYKWSMNTPTDMLMDFRSVDGLYTYFISSSSGAEISINISMLKEDVNFDKEFSSTKDSLKGYTLTTAEKSTDSAGNNIMLFAAKDKTEMIKYKAFFTPDKVYEIYLTYDTSKDGYEKALTVFDSFDLNFNSPATTHDLSNVDENGYRLFKDETCKVSFLIPQDFIDNMDGEENEFTFYSMNPDDNNSVRFGIYSKSDDLTAASLAEKDRQSNADYSNPKKFEVSEAEKYTLPDGTPGYSYSVTGGDIIRKDIFFEKGDYVYNLCIDTNSDNTSLLTDILNSLKVEQLDVNENGLYLRNDYEEDSSYTSGDDASWQLTIPLIWENMVTESPSGCSYIQKRTGSLLSFMPLGSSSSAPVNDVINSLYNDFREEPNSTVITYLTTEKIGNATYYTYTIKRNLNNDILYTTAYAASRSGQTYVFLITESEEAYGSKSTQEAKDIILSLTIN